MEPYGSDMFLSQEGYASIDFTLLDRPSSSVAAAPESTAALLPDSSFPSFDFLDSSSVDSFGGVLHTTGDAHFGVQPRLEMGKDTDWRKEKTFQCSSTDMYTQGGGNQQAKLSSPQFHIPVSQVDFFSPKQSSVDNLQGQLSTSGNRVRDEVHDFFEQEHLSQQQTQPERTDNWSVLNKSSWPEDSHNEESRFVHHPTNNTDLSRNNELVSTAMLTFMSRDTQPDDGRHASRMALGLRTQGGPSNNVTGQPRNQSLNFDNMLNGSTTGHIRANQTTSSGDGGTLERSHSNAGSLGGTHTQQGQNVGQCLNYDGSNSEMGESMEARVNYDFFGSQIQLKSQPEAGVQYHGARLQPTLDEMQVSSKQQYAYQQIQELHRQRQAQQLEQQAQQEAQQLENQARQLQLQQLQWKLQLQQQARQQLHVQQQARQHNAQLFERHPHVQQQQSQHIMRHASPQPAQLLEQQARQYQAQQIEHQARQQHTQQLEQQARQQQSQRFDQQARHHQAQQLEQQARQQQSQHFDQQAWHQRPQQLEQQAPQQQQNQQLERQSHQQQFHLLDQHARQLQAQQHFEQLARRQKQIQQLLAGGNQNLGNQLSSALYGSSLHDGSNIMRSTDLMSHTSVESHTPTLLPGNLPHLNIGNPNFMPNGLSSMPGFSPDLLRDPNLARKVLAAYMGPRFDPSGYGVAANTRDGAGQPLNSHTSSQGAVQQLADAPPHKLVPLANIQAGKEVAQTVVSGDPTPSTNNGKQGTLNKSVFEHSFAHKQGASNLQQGTTMSNTSQLQDFHSKQQHRSWNDDLGLKENFQNESSQDAPSESVFHNFQQGGWHNLPPTQAIGSSDGKNQIMNTGEHVLQGAYQAGNTYFFNSLAAKPQGSWSALMQSAVAESPSADGEPEDWSGLNLHRNETGSGDPLQLHPNTKEPNVWSEQTAQMHNSVDGRPLHLFNDESVQSVEGLQQDSSEGRDHIGSKLESMQHINQSKLQSGFSSKFLQEAKGQANKWQDHNPYQHIVKSSSQSYSNFESSQTDSWKDHNTAQIPSEAMLHSQHITFDGGHQNNILQNQGSFETERNKVLNLTSNNQSGCNKPEAEQNNLSLNANKGYRENENENIMHLQKEQLGGHMDKVGDQTYQTRYEGNKDAGVPFPRQDPRMNIYENGKPLQQGDFNMGTFPKHASNNNIENSSERLQHTSGMKYSLDGSERLQPRAIGNASTYCEGNSPQAWNAFPNSFSSPQGDPNGRCQTQYNQKDSVMPGQMMGKNDHTLQCAKVGNDCTRNSPQREDNLQSLSNANHRGYSRLGKMNIGLVGNSGNDKLRMMPGHMSQQMVGNASTNYRPADSGVQDPSLRGGTIHMDLIGQKSPEQTDFGQRSVARTVSINSTMQTGEDLLDTNLQTDLRETGGGHLKDISSGHTSSNSPAFDRSTNIGNANKLGSSPSQNVLDLLTKPDHLKGSDSSKGNVFGEQNVSSEMRESSDASLAHFVHNQALGPPQGFGLRLASPTQQQLLQMLHGQTLLSNSSQTARLLSDRPIHPPREDAVQKNTALMAHQVSSSSDGQRLHLTGSGQSINIPHELSAVVPKENAVDLKEKPSSVAAYDNHPSKSQMHHIQHTIVGGQLASSPQSMFLHTVPERQSNMQGSIMHVNNLQVSQGEVSGGQCNTVNPSTTLSVNDVVERESDMQGSLPSSAISFGHGGYSSDLHAQDGKSHKVMSLKNSMLGPRNANQFLHDSGSHSASNLPGTSGRSQSVVFSKLFNALKMNYTNQQGLPTVFESFRQPAGGPGLPFVPRPDNHIKFGIGGKSIVSVPNQPNIINYQQPASNEEFSNQENSFQVQQMPSDRDDSRESAGLHNPGMSLPVDVPILPPQTSVQGSQLSKVHTQGQDHRRLLVSKNNLSKSSAIIGSLHSGHHAHDEDGLKYIFGQDSKAIVHPTCQATQQQSDSCSDGPVDSQVSELSDAAHYQYVDKRKRMKITDASSSGIGRSLSIRSSDQIMNPRTGMQQFKVASTSTQHEYGAISADARMIPSSQALKERSESVSGQDMAAMMPRPLQNAGYNPIMYQFAQSSSAADDRSHVNPQFANARLFQFGAHSNELLLAAMYKRMSESGKSATLMSKQITSGTNVDCLVPGSGLATPVANHSSKLSLKEVESMAQLQNPAALSLPSTKRNDMDQYQYYLSKSNIGLSDTVLPKKRKKVASPLIPWHTEISQAGRELPSTRDAELAWATATNRLTEKEEDGIESREEGTKLVTRVKRRLKLTTQLMQQLIPPLPTAVVHGKAIIEYENATYTLAKTALGDACKLVSTLRIDGEKDVENENTAFGQIKKNKRLKSKSLQRIAEEFIDKAKNLDDEFSRFEGTLSITELRSETQDLDNLAITNRLVKHHGMSLPVDNTKNVIEDSLSDSYFCTRKQHLQRYVTAVPVPRNLPEGMLCISL